MDENNNVGDRQWLKFGILAGILLIVVLAIALLRPIIFDDIVPAVMGGDGTTAVNDETVVEEVPAETDTDTPIAPVDDTTETDSTVETETPIDDGVVNEEESTTETSVEEDIVDESIDGTETAVSTITYTVKPGDTIYSIAREHTVSPAAIVAANSLTDPNNILIGTELLIPQP